MITIDKAMLNVNSTSRAIGGSGNTTIARTASTPIGTPNPARNISRMPGIPVGTVVVVVVAMIYLVLVRVGIESRIDGRSLRHHGPVTSGALHLVDVGENLRYGDVEIARDLATDLHVTMQSARQWRCLENRHVIFASDFTNSGGNFVRALGDDDGSAHP